MLWSEKELRSDGSAAAGVIIFIRGHRAASKVWPTLVPASPYTDKSGACGMQIQWTCRSWQNQIEKSVPKKKKSSSCFCGGPLQRSARRWPSGVFLCCHVRSAAAAVSEPPIFFLTCPTAAAAASSFILPPVGIKRIIIKRIRIGCVVQLAPQRLLPSFPVGM